MNWIYAVMLFVASCSAGVGCTATVRLPTVDGKVVIQSPTCHEHRTWYGKRYVQCD